MDANRFQQAAINLLSNAVKFAPSQSSVTVRSCWHGDGVRVSVTDEGQGIPEEFRSRIFDRFQQANSSNRRTVGGTGLGLNITRSIIEAMDGTVSFDSTFGQGASFHIDLPIFISDIVKDAETELLTELQISRRILICGTDDDALLLTRKTLDDLGVVSDVASSLLAASALLISRSYASFIVDAGVAANDIEFEELERAVKILHIPIIILKEDGSVNICSKIETFPGIVECVGTPLTKKKLQLAIDRAAALTRDRIPKILYIEDDPFLQEIIAQSIGCSAVTTLAGSLAEARAQLETQEFDLVLLDQMLPDGRGPELISMIPSNTSIILYSAYDVPKEISDLAELTITKSVQSEITVKEAVLSIISRRPVSYSV
jgi:CheY-like chemotaxis protein